MENIVVIAGSDERTNKLLKHASILAKRSGSKIWLIYYLNKEKGNKDSYRNNRTASKNNNFYSISLKKSNRDNTAKSYLDELKKNGIVAEPLFIDKMNLKGFIKKILKNQDILEKAALIS